jgi:hypothetical protein
MREVLYLGNDLSLVEAVMRHPIVESIGCCIREQGRGFIMQGNAKMGMARQGKANVKHLSTPPLVLDKLCASRLPPHI